MILQEYPIITPTKGHLIMQNDISQYSTIRRPKAFKALLVRHGKMGQTRLIRNPIDPTRLSRFVMSTNVE